ncbi:C4-type zinc ribbon domain-containing protein, partial [Dehalococcoidia bacterium]|nr:C4-type zinc ribbon domain-containing protein [Dehalococcoidia bacterium]
DSSERIAQLRQNELTVLMASENSINDELPDLYERRKDMVSEVPPQTIAVYDNIRKVRGGHAVALVERGMCQACRISLPSTELQQARISQNIVRCDSCGRILVMT